GTCGEIWNSPNLSVSIVPSSTGSLRKKRSSSHPAAQPQPSSVGRSRGLTTPGVTDSCELQKFAGSLKPPPPPKAKLKPEKKGVVGGGGGGGGGGGAAGGTTGITLVPAWI